MITLIVDYPDNVDVCAHGLPMPNYVRTKETLVLTFDDQALYWSYLNSICDIVDNLEHARFFRFKQSNPDKIRISKVLLRRLMDLSLPI
jgi:hypothetical protein